MKIIYKSDQPVNAKFFVQHLRTWLPKKDVVAIFTNVSLYNNQDYWTEIKDTIITLVGKSIKDSQLIDSNVSNAGYKKFKEISGNKVNELKDLANNVENHWLSSDNSQSQHKIEDYLNLIQLRNVFSAYKYLSKKSVGMAVFEIMGNNILAINGICKKLSSDALLNLDTLKIIFSYLKVFNYNLETVTINLVPDDSTFQITYEDFSIDDWLSLQVERNDVEGIKKFLGENSSLNENSDHIDYLLKTGIDYEQCEIIGVILEKYPDSIYNVHSNYFIYQPEVLDYIIQHTDVTKLLVKLFSDNAIPFELEKVLDSTPADSKKELIKNELSKENPNQYLAICVDPDLKIALSLQFELFDSDADVTLHNNLSKFIFDNMGNGEEEKCLIEVPDYHVSMDYY